MLVSAGVLVLDRVNGVAYVALSERADTKLAEQWVDTLGYKDLVTFHSSDRRYGCCQVCFLYNSGIAGMLGLFLALLARLPLWCVPMWAHMVW